MLKRNGMKRWKKAEEMLKNRQTSKRARARAANVKAGKHTKESGN